MKNRQGKNLVVKDLAKSHPRQAGKKKFYMHKKLHEEQFWDSLPKLHYNFK